MSSIEDVRAVLKTNEALLIHFNTPMSRHEFGYPQDLHDALANPQWEMCYSTIQSAGLRPTQTDPKTAAACGCVGVVVNLTEAKSLLRVHSGDAGSNDRGWGAGMGSMPSRATCGDSIAGRTTGYNEWYLSNATPIGIFSFPEPAMFNPGVDEIHRGLAAVVEEFCCHRIFTASTGEFHEFDRNSGNWKVCGYGDIIPE